MSVSSTGTGGFCSLMRVSLCAGTSHVLWLCAPSRPPSHASRPSGAPTKGDMSETRTYVNPRTYVHVWTYVGARLMSTAADICPPADISPYFGHMSCRWTYLVRRGHISLGYAHHLQYTPLASLASLASRARAVPRTSRAALALVGPARSAGARTRVGQAQGLGSNLTVTVEGQG